MRRPHSCIGASRRTVSCLLAPMLFLETSCWLRPEGNPASFAIASHCQPASRANHLGWRARTCTSTCQGTTCLCLHHAIVFACSHGPITSSPYFSQVSQLRKLHNCSGSINYPLTERVRNRRQRVTARKCLRKRIVEALFPSRCLPIVRGVFSHQFRAALPRSAMCDGN